MKRAALLLCILLTGCGGAGEVTASPKGDQAFCEELRADLVEADRLSSTGVRDFYRDRDNRGYLVRRLAPTAPQDELLAEWGGKLTDFAYDGGEAWSLALEAASSRCLDGGWVK